MPDFETHEKLLTETISPTKKQEIAKKWKGGWKPKRIQSETNQVEEC